jgi:PPOX class probable F420-dependent enzyme
MDSTDFDALDRKAYISLATFKRNGDAVRTPVWFAGAAGKFYVFSEASAWKVKRLRRDERVRVAPCSVRGAIQGDWCEGRGRVVDDTETLEVAYDALQRKYSWQLTLVNLSSRLFGRIDGRAMLEIELD